MTSHALPHRLLLAAALCALSLPAAHAGSAINKCIDGAGRVTLTDQPCDAHTVRSSIAVPGTAGDGNDIPDNAPLGGQAVPATRAVLPLRQARWVPAAGNAPHAALAGDMATLKKARVQMLLQDAAPRARLASLDR